MCFDQKKKKKHTSNFIQKSCELLREGEITIALPWCDDHFTSIIACRVWGVRTEIQVSKRELTHIYT